MRTKLYLGVFLGLSFGLLGCSSSSGGAGNTNLLATQLSVSPVSGSTVTLFPNQTANILVKNTGKETAYNIQFNPQTVQGLAFIPASIPALSPGTSQTVEVMANPGSEGQGAVSVQSSNTNPVTFPIKVVPLIFTSGSLVLGSGETIAFSVANLGLHPVSGLQLFLSPPLKITQDSSCPSVLPARTRCQYILTVPAEAQTQTGYLSIQAAGARLGNKLIQIVRPEYSISLPEVGDAAPVKTITVNSFELKLIQISNTSTVPLEGLSTKLSTFPYVTLNNDCQGPLNLAPGDSCFIQLEVNDHVGIGQLGTLTVSTENANAPTSYPIMVRQSENLPSELEDFSLVGNRHVATGGVNYPVLASLELSGSLPSDFYVSDGKQTCDLNLLDQNTACGWTLQSDLCDPNQTHCQILFSVKTPKVKTKIEQNWTLNYGNQKLQTLKLEIVPGAYELPNDLSGLRGILPTRHLSTVTVGEDGTIYVGSDEGIAYSDDQGAYWHWFGPASKLPSPQVHDLLLEGSTLYVADGRFVVELENQGGYLTWKRNYDFPSSVKTVWALASDTNGLYAATDAGIYFLLEGSDVWTPVPETVSGNDVDLISGENWHYFLNASTRSLENYDSNLHSVTVLKTLSTGELNRVDADVGNDLAFTSDQGLYLSKDAGQHWFEVHSVKQIPWSPTTVLWQDENHLWVGSTAGFWMSRDGGQSFQLETQGSEWITDSALHNGEWFLATRDGLMVGTPQHWKVFDGVNAMFTRAALDLETTRMNFYVVGSHHLGLAKLWISRDAGESFIRATNLPSEQVNSVFVTEDSQGEDHVAASTQDRGLWLSEDAGNTWKNFSEGSVGFPSNTVNSAAFCGSGASRTILAATPVGLAVSQNNGTNWAGVFNNQVVKAVSFLSEDCQKVGLILGDGSIHLSQDRGMDWTVTSPSIVKVDSRLVSDGAGNFFAVNSVTGTLTMGIPGTGKTTTFTWKTWPLTALGLPSAILDLRAEGNLLVVAGQNYFGVIEIQTLLTQTNLQSSDWKIINSQNGLGEIAHLSVLPYPELKLLQIFGLGEGLFGTEVQFQ